MSNFLTDNPDLLFTLKNLDMREVVSLFEKGYTENQKFDTAPDNYEDALDGYTQVLEVVGDIAGERIAPRSRQVDEEGPKFENNEVTDHPLTVQNLEDLRKAGVMGVILGREYGGLNFPLLHHDDGNGFPCRRKFAEPFRFAGYCRNHRRVR